MPKKNTVEEAAAVEAQPDAPLPEPVPDPTNQQPAVAVTGRPNDLVDGKVSNSSFASRAKTRFGGTDKQVRKADAK